MFSYTPKPQHIILPVIILLLTAVVTGLFPSWQTAVAFIIIAIICLAMGVSIAVSISIEKYSTYWENIGRDIDKLQKTPPELWGTLGFVTPPQTVTLRKEMTGEPGYSMDYSMIVITLNLSPEKMQVLANSLLTGAKTLAEGEWKNTDIGQDKIRKVKQEMLDAGLIELRNPRNHLTGYMLTRKGVLYLWEYASDYVKKEVDLDTLLSHVNPTPSGTPLLSNIVD
jgi:hypothetical protein